jgi:hypothetical protein
MDNNKRKISIYQWTLKFQVQATTEEVAKELFMSHISAFIARGNSVEEGTITKVV